ncbi:MAG: hypothetical protein ACXV8I_01575 [Methylobacter sp.]
MHKSETPQVRAHGDETETPLQSKNWSEYNQALVNRGSLTLWFEESQLERWHQPERIGYRGSPMIYSD